MTELDTQRDLAWDDLRHRRAATNPPATEQCNHATCTKKRCPCTCHHRPTQPPVAREPTANTSAELSRTLDSATRILAATKIRLPLAVERAMNDTDDGHKPPNTSPAVSGGNDEPDLFSQVFMRVGKAEDERWIPKTDSIRASYDLVVHNLRQIEVLAAAAYNATKALQGMTLAEAQKALLTMDTASCINCSRVVANSGTDWLRRGRCSACNVYLDRNGIERPEQLW